MKRFDFTYQKVKVTNSFKVVDGKIVPEVKYSKHPVRGYGDTLEEARYDASKKVNLDLSMIMTENEFVEYTKKKQEELEKKEQEEKEDKEYEEVVEVD